VAPRQQQPSVVRRVDASLLAKLVADKTSLALPVERQRRQLSGLGLHVPAKTLASYWAFTLDLLSGPSGALAPIGDAIRSTSAVVAGREVAVPIVLAGEVVAVVAASGSDVTSANAAAIDVLTRYAARSLEAMTAFKTARAVADRGAGGHDAAAAEEDASARRYARLLVSEIKLYHEPAVIEGRRDRDLAARLGGEIARARALYEERVPPHVRRRADHFRDELVRTLADGDASLLQLS